MALLEMLGIGKGTHEEKKNVSGKHTQKNLLTNEQMNWNL